MEREGSGRRWVWRRQVEMGRRQAEMGGTERRSPPI